MIGKTRCIWMNRGSLANVHLIKSWEGAEWCVVMVETIDTEEKAQGWAAVHALGCSGQGVDAGSSVRDTRIYTSNGFYA